MEMDIIQSILVNLSPSRLQHLRLVSKSWNALITSREFKQHYFSTARDKAWLVMSGANMAYHLASKSWCTFPMTIFYYALGVWWEEDEDDSHPLEVINLRWTYDGVFFCCMDCSGDNGNYYDSDDPAMTWIRLMVFDCSTGSYQQLPNLERPGWPIGVGILEKCEGKEYNLVMVATGRDYRAAKEITLHVSTYDSCTKKWKLGTRCYFSQACSDHCSNFVLDGCLYFLFDFHRNLGITVLCYKIVSDSWYHWDTTLHPEFFSQVAIEINLLRCGGRILAVGGIQEQVVIVQLKAPLEGETSERVLRRVLRYRVTAPNKDQHNPRTWKEIARMPQAMLKDLRVYSKSLRAFGNDFFIFVVPDPKPKGGEKGVMYSLLSQTWEWMAPFPEECLERWDLRWWQLLGHFSTVIRHPVEPIYLE